MDEDPETVARILHLRHDAGCSLRQICSVLEFEGRPAAGGECWDPKMVARVLARAGVNEPRRVEELGAA